MGPAVRVTACSCPQGLGPWRSTGPLQAWSHYPGLGDSLGQERAATLGPTPAGPRDWGGFARRGRSGTGWTLGWVCEWWWEVVSVRGA